VFGRVVAETAPIVIVGGTCCDEVETVLKVLGKTTPYVFAGITMAGQMYKIPLVVWVA
jgi:hypothetical protein